MKKSTNPELGRRLKAQVLNQSLTYITDMKSSKSRQTEMDADMDMEIEMELEIGMSGEEGYAGIDTTASSVGTEIFIGWQAAVPE